MRDEFNNNLKVPGCMSLMTKITSMLLLVLVISLFVSGWISVHKERQVLTGLLEDHGKSLSHAVAVFCIETLLSEDYPVLDTFLETTGREREDILSIEVFHNEKLVSGYSVEENNFTNRAMFSSDIHLPFVDGELPEKIGEVRLRLSGDENELIITSRIRQLIISRGIIFVLLFLVLTFLIRRIVLRKVEQLSQHAQLIGEGELEMNLNLKSSDELGALAQTMNQMSAKMLSSQEEIRSQNEELKKLDKMKSEFLANMSHEIRTPMNAIIGMTELTLETELSTEQKKYMKTVQSNSDMLLNLLNDILDFSKICEGKINIENTTFSIRDIIEEVTGTLEITAKDKGIELISDIDVVVPSLVVGDRNRIRQVLMNLVGNGIKFTDEGEVVVRVEAQDVDINETIKLLFSVYDTGIGIPEEKQGMIFEKFSQVDNSSTRNYEGVGLGLNISKSLIELMGGNVWLKSEEGKGTTISYTLNLEIGERDDLIDHIYPEFEDIDILIVDDNKTNRLILQKTLGKWGFQVHEARNGKEALEFLRHNVSKLKLVILDYHMPEMDGLMVVRSIRDDSMLHELKVIVLSSLGSLSPDIVRELGIVELATKPVRQTQLLDIIKRALQCDMTKEITPEFACQDRETLNHEQTRLLIVEDNVDNTDLARRLLMKAGYIVDISLNGDDAIEAVKEFNYDLVLMDIQMPGMDGFEATRRIRVIEKELMKDYTPVIAVTAHAMKGYRDKCIEEGMDDYITKPLKKSVLLRTVDKWIGMRTNISV